MDGIKMSKDFNFTRITKEKKFQIHMDFKVNSFQTLNPNFKPKIL